MGSFQVEVNEIFGDTASVSLFHPNNNSAGTAAASASKWTVDDQTKLLCVNPGGGPAARLLRLQDRLLVTVDQHRPSRISAVVDFLYAVDRATVLDVAEYLSLKSPRFGRLSCKYSDLNWEGRQIWEEVRSGQLVDIKVEREKASPAHSASFKVTDLIIHKQSAQLSSRSSQRTLASNVVESKSKCSNLQAASIASVANGFVVGSPPAVTTLAEATPLVQQLQSPQQTRFLCDSSTSSCGYFQSKQQMSAGRGFPVRPNLNDLQMPYYNSRGLGAPANAGGAGRGRGMPCHPGSQYFDSAAAAANINTLQRLSNKAVNGWPSSFSYAGAMPTSIPTSVTPLFNDDDFANVRRPESPRLPVAHMSQALPMLQRPLPTGASTVDYRQPAREATGRVRRQTVDSQVQTDFSDGLLEQMFTVCRLCIDRYKDQDERRQRFFRDNKELIEFYMNYTQN